MDASKRGERRERERERGERGERGERAEREDKYEDVITPRVVLASFLTFMQSVSEVWGTDFRSLL